MLDSVGRFVANVGVPAAIAFLILWQLTGRLDTIAQLQQEADTQLTIMSVSCARPTLPPAAP